MVLHVQDSFRGSGLKCNKTKQSITISAGSCEWTRKSFRLPCDKNSSTAESFHLRKLPFTLKQSAFTLKISSAVSTLLFCGKIFLKQIIACTVKSSFEELHTRRILSLAFVLNMNDSLDSVAG